MSDLEILAIPGSLRTASVNALFCRDAARLAPTGLAIEHYRDLGRLPHYDADLDVEAAPDAVAELRERISAVDGLLIATPEYNGGIPGVLKNALDWASTPYGASALTGKPVAVMGVTPGRSGTAGAQAQLTQVLTRIGCQVVEGYEVKIARCHDVLDECGRITDDAVAESVASLLDGLRLTALQDESARAAA